MNKRWGLVFALSASALVGPLGSFAQEQGKVWRVGVLDTTSTNAVYLEAFRKGLRELGYVEGGNLVIEYRSADGRTERLAELAMELVHAKVDVIVPRGTLAAKAAKDATGVIPIVMSAVGSPVESGLVKSLSHPGGNVTGLSSISGDLSTKRVELLRETVPGVKRIGGLTNLSTLMLQLTGNRSRRKVGRWGSRYNFSMCAKPKILRPPSMRRVSKGWARSS